MFASKSNLMISVIISALVYTTLADLFTSIAEMELLLESEKEMPQLLDKYIERFEKRLTKIKQISLEQKRRNNLTYEEGMQIIGNPISAYHLIKNIVGEWNHIKYFIESSVGKDLKEGIQEIRAKNHAKCPTREDLHGAALALLRLQDTYRLNVKQMADGNILNISNTKPLTAKDCFEIGRAAYKEGDFYHTIQWVQEAKERLENEKPHETIPKYKVLELLAFSLYKQGNLKRALVLTEQLVKIVPENSRARNNIDWYKNLLIDEGVKPTDFRRNIPPIKNPRGCSVLDANEREVFEALCRDELSLNAKYASKLYCYYKMDRPFLRLAPIKVEILRFAPLAVMFRDVISDEEVRVIRMLAIRRLRRATVQNPVSGAFEFASYRISKSAWLSDDEHEVVRRLSRRSDLMTNLEQQTAEEFQVGNYGIGGHYEPHYDFSKFFEKASGPYEMFTFGNRMATLLFYEERSTFQDKGYSNFELPAVSVQKLMNTQLIKMTQPEHGGATVFTYLRTAVAPSKNDALFWYNTMRNGESDYRTRHGACPVLVGVKWVAIKWIHIRGQEFRRPCGLREFSEDRFIGDLGGPLPRNHWNIRS